MTSYLVAGASRGIGLALTQALASQPSTSTIFAGVRNTNDPTLSTLKSNPKIRVVELDITSDISVSAAAEDIAQQNGGKLDVVIVNAGVAKGSFTSTSTAADLEANLATNTIGVYRTILAFLPLVRAGNAKKILALSTGGARFTTAPFAAQLGIPLGPYGISKAALNFMMLLLGGELANEGILTASVNPGVVATDMTAEVAAKGGKEFTAKFEKIGLVFITPQACAEGLVKVVDGLDSDKSGKFLEWKDGEVRVSDF